MMWLNPPNNLVLNEGEVHIWRADLEVEDRSQSSFLKLLSPDEKNRAQKFRFARDKSTFIAARGILRTLIGKYLEVNPAEITFQYNEFGKPSIANNNQLHFNISHSQNVALFAFINEYNVGIDVEFLNPNIEAKDIASNFFSANEILKLLALPQQQQTLGFFHCWTRKEAFIKAVGEGLSFPLDQFEVSLEPNNPARLLATNWDPKDISRWSIYSLSPWENFVGGLVIEGNIDKLLFWNWQKS